MRYEEKSIYASLIHLNNFQKKIKFHVFYSMHGAPLSHVDWNELNDHLRKSSRSFLVRLFSFTDYFRSSFRCLFSLRLNEKMYETNGRIASYFYFLLNFLFINKAKSKKRNWIRWLRSLNKRHLRPHSTYKIN